jgi:AraC-like DNA-binding protein
VASLVAQAVAGMSTTPAGGGAVNDLADVRWEELGLELAARAVTLAEGASTDQHRLDLGSEARVTRTVRTIDQYPEAPITLSSIAGDAGLSPYHCLRTFERITGVTPHQYVLRARLREAALRLAAEPSAKVIDVALDSGFGDVSNFNRAFRNEFGTNPRHWRSQPIQR